MNVLWGENMNFDEKEIQKILNREKVLGVNIYDNEFIITTEDKEIVISAKHDILYYEINDREIVE